MAALCHQDHVGEELPVSLQNDLVWVADNLLQFQGIHDVYRLGQDLIDGRHFGRWGINSRQVAHSILHHMRVIADENVVR